MSSEFIKRILSSIVLLPLLFFIVIEGSFLFVTFLAICFFISTIEWNNMSKKLKYKNVGLLFLLISFLSIYNLRLNYNDNYILFMYIIITCVSTDIGGYIFGKLFKGPKLTIYSPNKTIAGMLGGFIMSILSMFVLIHLYENQNFSIKLFIFVIFISVISQLGDIVVSYFKRLANIKDTGNLIPGHGGLLDRIDGMIFAFPFANIFIFINFY
ncbi:phosphatidate cytidylyltransferase [Candidatus Pelagibacter sp.]|nr:phosphatidate cytidylyltransferase [Candidatus Pelagibacter sp.]